jgi:asparagine synthase (glutamine-hydrolysing)
VSAIVGVFHHDGRPVAGSEIDALSAASRHRALDGENVWIHGSFGVAHQHARNTPGSLTEQQPLVSPAHTVVCIDGRLDNREELAPSYPNNDKDASDAALVLGAYDRYVDRFASHLNGDFAVAVFDAGRQQLVLARDVMAARPLYYCPIPGTVLFASEIKSILAHPRVTAAPEVDTIAELMFDDWADAERSCFRGVFSVPPGSMAVVTSGGVVIREHWAFDPAKRVRLRSFGEYVEAFRGLFEQSVRRRLRSSRPVAVAVSGGVDSSAIFCQASIVARRSGAAPPRGITMIFPAGSRADEQAYVEDIESAYGTTIARVSGSNADPVDANAVVGHLEMPGTLGSSHNAVLERARAEGCRVMLDGFFGDQMLFTRGGYLVDLARTGRWIKVHRDLREFAAWMTDADPGYFRHDFRRAFVRSLPPRWLFRTMKRHVGGWRGRTSMYPTWFTDRLRQRAVARHTRPIDYRAPPATHHAQELYGHATAGHYLSQVQRQIGAGLMYGVDVCYPFRDRDLVAFLMAIPGEIVNWNGVPKGLMREALKGVLPERIRTRRWKADLTEVGNQAAVRELDAIARLLTRDCLSARVGFVDGNVLERSIAGVAKRIAEDDTAVERWRLAAVVGLEMWLRRFFESPVAGV